MTEDVTLLNGFPFIPYRMRPISPDEMSRLAEELLKTFRTRRSVREFSREPVDRAVIMNCLEAASTAPSGANKQPYTFCLVSDPHLKKQIREAAEKEEYESYTKRMSDEWLDDIRPLQTDWHKPFLETAPYLIVVFKKAFDFTGKAKKNNYYVTESVGLACGFLLAALHQVGLAALTHTPSPMNFLSSILQRPENERPFLLIPVGYAAPDALVPDIKRKEIRDLVVEY
ncbi:MAG: nitroreductase family protein [Cyclobacteriaceae bacterium]|jgi:iodotyrosine deiodinase|nr:nitroreductase family protein [Flammeovirgaceae bacterium]